MFENVKVIKDFMVADISEAHFRKEYGYHTTSYEKTESRKVVYKKMQDFARQLITSTGMKIKVIGKENLPSQGPVVYMATHKSLFDIVILFAMIDDPCIVIGKKELQQMPFVNKWFDALGCIYIDREDKRSALTSIIKGIEEIKAGQSIIIFPEGTRYMTNDVQHFKEGSFKLATKTLVPIVPIALSNTYKVFEEKKRIQKAEVVVHIGKPIPTKELSNEALRELPGYVEEQVKALMAAII